MEVMEPNDTDGAQITSGVGQLMNLSAFPLCYALQWGPIHHLGLVEDRD